MIKPSHYLDLLHLDEHLLFQQYVRLDRIGVDVLTGLEITKRKTGITFRSSDKD
jgi:hypothetical protein